MIWILENELCLRIQEKRSGVFLCLFTTILTCKNVKYIFIFLADCKCFVNKFCLLFKLWLFVLIIFENSREVCQPEKTLIFKQTNQHESGDGNRKCQVNAAHSNMTVKLKTLLFRNIQAVKTTF